MVASHDETSGSGAPPIRDQRTAPKGVLPRQLQMWLMVGLAVLILGIILVTGRTVPTPRTAAVMRTTTPSALAPDRIQAYQRQLAEDEARLRRELAQASTPTPPPAQTMSPSAPREPAPANPIADEQRRREYQSLFADNVALSHRSADATSYGERATSARIGPLPASPPTLSPQDVLLLQALMAQRAPAPVLPPPATTTAAPGGTMPDARAAASERPVVPKETGPIRSSDPRQRLTEGTVIETVLINRLDGTFAGPVECLVTTPVYTQDRQRVVIPAGARILGTAAPVQAWGDARLAVSFHRLLMPDGRAYSLDQFKGLDQMGETGLKDAVNRHYLEVFGASVAIGALSGLAQFGTRGGFGSTSFADEYRQAAGASLAASTSRVLDRYLNVLPTITIREGFRITVYLTNDLELPAFTELAGGTS